jgi:hypothetical protein
VLNSFILKCVLGNISPWVSQAFAQLIHKVTTSIFPTIFMEQTALDEWYNVFSRNREHHYLKFSITKKISPFRQWPQWFISLCIRFECPNSGFLRCVAYVFHDLYLPGSLHIVTLGLVEKEANATIKFMLPTMPWVIGLFSLNLSLVSATSKTKFCS